MRLFPWILLMPLLVACVSSPDAQTIGANEAVSPTSASNQAQSQTMSAKAPQSQGFFAHYLNREIKLENEKVAQLSLEGRPIGPICAAEFAPLLHLGLDGFIQNLETARLVPFSLPCQAGNLRESLHSCDFPPIPAMPLSRDCRNQLALLRIQLVAQLDAGHAIAEMPATLVAHRIVAQLMGDDKSSQQALALCNHLLDLDPNDVDAHSVRVLLLVINQKLESDKRAFEQSIAKLEQSQRPMQRDFANLMQFNVALLDIMRAPDAAAVQRLQSAAGKMAQYSLYPAVGQEAKAVAAFYRGDKGEAIRIMRTLASSPAADGETQDTLQKLESGDERPFRIKMFYSFQF